MINEWDYWAKLTMLFSKAYDDCDRVKSKRGWLLFLDSSRFDSKHLRNFVEMLISELLLVESGDKFVLSSWKELQRLLACHPASRVLELHFDMIYRDKIKF